MQGQALSDIENYMLSTGRPLKNGRGECPLCGHGECFVAKLSDHKGKGRWYCVRVECEGHNIQNGQKTGGHDLIELVMMNDGVGYAEACGSLGINLDQSGGSDSWKPSMKRIQPPRVVPEGAIDWSVEFPRIVDAHRSRARAIEKWAESRGWPAQANIEDNPDVAPWPKLYRGISAGHADVFGAKSIVWIALRNEEGTIVSAQRLLRGVDGGMKRVLSKDSCSVVGESHFGDLPGVVAGALGLDKELYLVEGATDYVAACVLFGRDRVMGALSASTMPGLAESMLKALAVIGARPKVWVIPDDDSAGLKASENTAVALATIDSGVVGLNGCGDLSDAFTKWGHETIGNLDMLSHCDAELIFPIIVKGHPGDDKRKAEPDKIVNDRAENTQALLTYMGVHIKVNMMEHRRETLWVDGAYRTDDESDAEIREGGRRNGYRVPVVAYQEHMSAIARHNAYHPAKDWVMSKPWDGKDRTGTLWSSIQLAEDSDPGLAGILLYRWCMQAVASLMNLEGSKSEGVLVFCGPQGCGKTRWFSSLSPIGISTGLTLDPADKDSVILATGNWICELGELDATFRRADRARLKSFLSMDVDIIRKHYGRHSDRQPRRTTFGGSVNDVNFLRDRTGNRRFWVIEVTGCIPEHGVDMQQFWAQMADAYSRDRRVYLLPHELDQLNKSNLDHLEEDPIKSILLDEYDITEDKAEWTLKSEVRDRIRDRFTSWTQSQDRLLTPVLSEILAEVGRRKPLIKKGYPYLPLKRRTRSP